MTPTSVSAFFSTQSPVRSQNYEPREHENMADKKKSRAADPQVIQMLKFAVKFNHL